MININFKNIVLFVLVSFMATFWLVACTSNKKIVFSGEGPNWRVVNSYVYSQNMYRGNYEIIYKKPVEKNFILKYEIKPTKNDYKVGGEAELNDTGVIKHPNSYQPAEDEVFIATIEWQEKKETIKLTSDK